MSKKKTKQRAQKDVTNGTRKIRNQRDMLRVLLHRDPRSATLAHLILQLYGYCPREQERSDEEIAAEMQTLREALAQAYGVDMDERPLPQAEELEEIRQGIISDLESGNEWLHPDGVELLAFLDQACPTLTAHIRHEMSTQQIPETLKANVLNTLVDNVMNTFEGIASREGQDETIDHLRLVIQAIHAEARAQQFTEWSDAEKEGRITQALEQEVKHQVTNASGHRVRRTQRNWVAPGKTRFVQDSYGSIFLETSPACPPPPGEPPTLTITIDLSKVHLVGVTELATMLTSDVKRALENLPPAWQSYPPELDFLRMISVENFTRDLQRYDLHMQHGYPFRYIAWLETQERAGHQAHPSVPHPIGTEIPGEDGVEKSVKRIYTAIHRTPYRARRRPLDTPAQGLDEYACPSHPLGDCPEDCPSLTDFMERFNASAPTATTGRGKEIVSFESIESHMEKSSHTGKASRNS